MNIKRNRDCERRLLLLDMLRNRYDHPDANECYKSIKKLVPDIGRSTVYRHHKFLKKNGLITSLSTKNRRDRFDANIKNHYHFFCYKCGSLQDVVLNKENAIKWPGQPHSITIIANGLCDKCLNNN